MATDDVQAGDIPTTLSIAVSTPVNHVHVNGMFEARPSGKMRIVVEGLTEDVTPFYEAIQVIYKARLAAQAGE